MKLYEAVRHGNLESIQSALATGLSVDCRDKFNKTPLMVASGHGRVDVVEFLLERGYAWKEEGEDEILEGEGWGGGGGAKIVCNEK